MVHLVTTDWLSPLSPPHLLKLETDSLVALNVIQLSMWLKLTLKEGSKF